MREFKLEGMAKLNRNLQKLEGNLGIRTLSAAAGFAMTPVAGAARRNAPIGTVAHKTHKGRTVSAGFLKRNIKKKTIRWKNKKGVTVKVGPSSEAFYGSHFVEVGKSKKHKQRANPWLVPAFESQQHKVIQRFKSRLEEKIAAAIR